MAVDRTLLLALALAAVQVIANREDTLAVIGYQKRYFRANTDCDATAFVTLTGRIANDCAPFFVHELHRMDISDRELDVICKEADIAKCEECAKGARVVMFDGTCKIEEGCSPVTEQPLPTMEQPLPITEQPLPTTEQPLPIMEQPLPTTEQPTTTEQPPTTTEQPPTTTEQLPRLAESLRIQANKQKSLHSWGTSVNWNVERLVITDSLGVSAIWLAREERHLEDKLEWIREGGENIRCNVEHSGDYGFGPFSAAFNPIRQWSGHSTTDYIWFEISHCDAPLALQSVKITQQCYSGNNYHRMSQVDVIVSQGTETSTDTVSLEGCDGDLGNLGQEVLLRHTVNLLASAT